METADIERRLDNLIRLGTIAEVDHAARKLRVKSGELLTDWLPWPAEIGRNYKRWRPLRLNTQVVLACPTGDPAQAVIISMLYTNALNSPSTDDAVDLIAFDDGSFVEHNASDNTLKIHSAGDLLFSAVGTISHTANAHEIEGPVTQTGGDMTSDGISAQHHPHGGVVAGPDSSGEPE